MNAPESFCVTAIFSVLCYVLGYSRRALPRNRRVGSRRKYEPMED